MMAPRWRKRSALNIAISTIGAVKTHAVIHMNFLVIFLLSLIVQMSKINRVIPNANPRTDVLEYEKNIEVITNREGITITEIISLVLTHLGRIVFCFILAFTKFTCLRSSDLDCFFMLLSDMYILSRIKPRYRR